MKNFTSQLEVSVLINLKPLNIRTRLNIIKIDYVCTFIMYLLYIIIIGVKYHFLRLGLELGLGSGVTDRLRLHLGNHKGSGVTDRLRFGLGLGTT